MHPYPVDVVKPGSAGIAARAAPRTPVDCQPACEMAGSDSLQVEYETRIAAPVDAVFPLACPVEEYKWIPGWKCDLVHCPFP